MVNHYATLLRIYIENSTQYTTNHPGQIWNRPSTLSLYRLHLSSTALFYIRSQLWYQKLRQCVVRRIDDNVGFLTSAIQGRTICPQIPCKYWPEGELQSELLASPAAKLRRGFSGATFIMPAINVQRDIPLQDPRMYMDLFVFHASVSEKKPWNFTKCHQALFHCVQSSKKKIFFVNRVGNMGFRFSRLTAWWSSHK